MKSAKPGAVIADLAEIGIQIARDAGYEQYLYFRGHGIGCATHDLPSFAQATRRSSKKTWCSASSRCLSKRSSAPPAGRISGG